MNGSERFREKDLEEVSEPKKEKTLK